MFNYYQIQQIKETHRVSENFNKEEKSFKSLKNFRIFESIRRNDKSNWSNKSFVFVTSILGETNLIICSAGRARSVVSTS